MRRLGHIMSKVAGVPFAPGAEVEITMSPKLPGTKEVVSEDDQAWAEARARMQKLLGTIHGFRNSPRIPREELYEHGRIR